MISKVTLRLTLFNTQLLKNAPYLVVFFIENFISNTCSPNSALISLYNCIINHIMPTDSFCTLVYSEDKETSTIFKNLIAKYPLGQQLYQSITSIYRRALTDDRLPILINHLIFPEPVETSHIFYIE